jgi:7-keto-8-aminopelargonate synthetase-like enzyme
MRAEFASDILTDGLFGHDRSAAPLRKYLKILPARGMLLANDAHGVGVLGATGKGALEHECVNTGFSEYPPSPKPRQKSKFPAPNGYSIF